MLFRSPFETHDPARTVRVGQDECEKIVGENDFRAFADLFSPDQAFPFGVGPFPQQEKLNFSTGFFFSVNSRRKDFRLVSDEKVAGIQVIADVAKMAMLDAVSFPVINEKAGAVARFDRRLRDAFRRQRVIKVSGFQFGSAPYKGDQIAPADFRRAVPDRANRRRIGLARLYSMGYSGAHRRSEQLPDRKSVV